MHSAKSIDINGQVRHSDGTSLRSAFVDGAAGVPSEGAGPTRAGIVAELLPRASSDSQGNDTAYGAPLTPREHQQVAGLSGDTYTSFVTCDACFGTGHHAHFRYRNCSICCGSGWL
jgi:DnaJ-class molecular chaperone